MSHRRKTMLEPVRIGLVWDPSAMRSQQVLHGLCRRAEAQPELSLRRFDLPASGFRKKVLEPLIEWQPHAVVLRLDQSKDIHRLRDAMKGVPFVAACRMPPHLVDTMVVGDAYEVVRMAREHLREQGVEMLALWAPGAPEGAASLTSIFRSEIPNGSVLAHHMSTRQLQDEPGGQAFLVAGDWLKSLPKPVGVITFSGYGAPFLARVCKQLGLRVPRDIQLIGCDDADACLECSPHLTTVIPTGELIGEAAMEAALAHLAKSGPRPPKTVRVPGCTLIARGSTGPVRRISRSVGKAANIIQARATEGYTAEEVIRLARQGRSTFYKQFRDATGSSPGKQLRARRIDVAKRLLVSSAASITDVAEKCGFSSANYFSQVFRRETGMSPGEYRLKGG